MTLAIHFNTKLCVAIHYFTVSLLVVNLALKMPHRTKNWIKTSCLVLLTFTYRNNCQTNTIKSQIEDNRHMILDQEKELVYFAVIGPIMLLSTLLSVLNIKMWCVCIDVMAVSNPLTMA